MNYITLSQQKKPQNLYLYPMEDYSVDFTPIGESDNYACVDDEYGFSDGNNTYVYSQSTSLATDIYCFYTSSSTVSRPISDYTYAYATPVGASSRWDCVDDEIADDDSTYINFSSTANSYPHYYYAYTEAINKPCNNIVITKVEVFARAKAITDNSYVYLEIKVGSNFYNQQFALYTFQGWTDLTATWTTNPSTGENWTWDDIKNGLIIGFYYFYTPQIKLTQLYLKVYYKCYSVEYPTGDINYIKLNSIAKSDYLILSDANFYLTFYSSPTYYYSNNKYLSTDWYNYNYTWITNPSTGTSWTWSDIQNLKAGITIKSDGESSIQSNTYRPTSNYSTNLQTIPSGYSNYECVNEETANDDSDYVLSGTPNWKSDIYNITVGSSPTNLIDILEVSLYAKTKSVSPTTNGSAKLFLYISTTEYYSDTFSTNSWWTLHSYTWSTNPATSSNWTWSDIQNLKIGISLFLAQCTQLYFIVKYTVGNIPKLKTTQFYAQINYNPDESTCTLPSPSYISRNHSRNIKMLNFWSGNREVYDYSRNSKSMVMQGKLWGSTATDTIECVRQMGLDGSDVTISGFDYSFFNGTFKIKSFGWCKISEKPLVFDWMLELEDAEL